MYLIINHLSTQAKGFDCQNNKTTQLYEIKLRFPICVPTIIDQLLRLNIKSVITSGSEVAETQCSSRLLTDPSLPLLETKNRFRNPQICNSENHDGTCHSFLQNPPIPRTFI